MSVIVTSVARVKDWQAVAQAWRVLCARRAIEWGACRFGLYRNIHDASQALVLTELPDLETLCEMGDLFDETMRALCEPAQCDERSWEAMDAIRGTERRHGERER